MSHPWVLADQPWASYRPKEEQLTQVDCPAGLAEEHPGEQQTVLVTERQQATRPLVDSMSSPYEAWCWKSWTGFLLAVRWTMKVPRE